MLLPNISGFLQMPLIEAYGSAEVVEQKLITYKPMGVFSVFIQIAFLGGLVLSMPFFSTSLLVLLLRVLPIVSVVWCVLHVLQHLFYSFWGLRGIFYYPTFNSICFGEV